MSMDLIQGTAEHMCRLLSEDDLQTSDKIVLFLRSLGDTDFELVSASMLFIIASHVAMPEEDRRGFFAACGIALEMMHQIMEENEDDTTQH